jgi:hypothetical protein
MNIVTVDANNIATDILAAIHWLGQLNLHLMACPVGKIGKAGQWTVNAGRAHFESVRFDNWVKLVKFVGYTMRQSRTVVDTKLPRIGTLGHYLQGWLVAALPAGFKPRDTHQRKAERFCFGCNQRGQCIQVRQIQSFLYDMQSFWLPAPSGASPSKISQCKNDSRIARNSVICKPLAYLPVSTQLR